MAVNARFAVVGLVLLWGPSAFARFGKASTSSTTHSASSANSSSKGDSSGSSGGTASDSTTVHHSWIFAFLRPALCGFWSGAFVPWYGYGLRRDSAEGDNVDPDLVDEGDSTRLVAGLESQFFGNGFNLGANVSAEFGSLSLSAQGSNITVRADEGRPGWDNLQHISARLGYTFLAGRFGRWRAEAGADGVFAPNLIVFGPTIGTSGVVWLAGPLAAEGSAYWTFYPYDQVDLRLGAAVGLGPVGLRAGWRMQVLSDRGLVDTVVHTDIFSGPYVGVGLTL